MKIGSISENKSLEKRVSITPETAKKYINLGFEVLVDTNYGSHIGFHDLEYKSVGVNIYENYKEHPVIKLFNAGAISLNSSIDYYYATFWGRVGSNFLRKNRTNP